MKKILLLTSMLLSIPLESTYAAQEYKCVAKVNRIFSLPVIHNVPDGYRRTSVIEVRGLKVGTDEDSLKATAHISLISRYSNGESELYVNYSESPSSGLNMMLKFTEGEYLLSGNQKERIILNVKNNLILTVDCNMVDSEKN